MSEHCSLSEQLATILVLREENLLSEPKRTDTVEVTIPDYFSKHYNRVLRDPLGEYRSLIEVQSVEEANSFITFSKQIFNQVSVENNIVEPSNYKLISKSEITRQSPLLQALMVKRQHECIAPKIVNVPSSVVRSTTPSFENVNSNNSVVQQQQIGRKPIRSSHNNKSSDVMVIDDDEEKQPKSSFVTAKQLVKKNKGSNSKDIMSDDENEEETMKKKTLSDIKNPTSNYHPVTSLTRNCGENTGGTKRKKFVPPLKDNGNNNSNNNNNSSSNSGEKPAKKKKKGADEKAPDLSKLFEDGEIPEELSHLDPKLIETISNEILESKVSVTWDDIAGLAYAKKSVQEAVIWPLMRPDLFTGLRKPPKGLLLFGPPGTGKTLIGKAIAHESGSTFFSISASSLTSKWVGEGEKLVKTLFSLARYFQPSVVFIDEIDSLLSQRSDGDADNGSRRLKTEFLVQLDGASTNDDQDRILIVGATNRPEEIDEAVRRRMGKRLYIPLPSKEGRKEMFLRLLAKNPNTLSDEEMEKLVELTDGYSGSDIKNLCAEASMFSVRDLGSFIKHASADQLRPIEFKDCRSALKSIRPSVAQSDLDRYIEWNRTFGSFDFDEKEQEESSAKSD